MPMAAFDLLYYIYILLFGVFISMRIACGRLGRRQWRVFGALCPLLLLLQGICLQLLGMDELWMLYPLIVHLPMALALAAALKVRWKAALVSVAISYSMCQLPRWIGLALQALGARPPALLIIHIAASHLLLVLLDRYCLDPIHQTVSSVNRLLLRFGALPLLYYLYEYFMLYTHWRYAAIQAFDELLSTGLVLFFILFAVAYRKEAAGLERAKYQASALEMQLKHAEQEVTSLRALQEQTAIYRHDIRHHLMMIDGLLASGQSGQAAQYIRRATDEIDSITPTRYCENETVNLLLGALHTRAERLGVQMRVKADLPPALPLPDTELCALICNGLENALNAASHVPGCGVDIFCGVRQSQLLFEIRNSYAGEIAFRDGLPAADDSREHFGCRSIQSIVQRRKGMCSFEACGGVFILRIAIPLSI